MSIQRFGIRLSTPSGSGTVCRVGVSVVLSIHFPSPGNGLSLADLQLGYNLGSEFSFAGQGVKHTTFEEGGNLDCRRRSRLMRFPERSLD